MKSNLPTDSGLYFIPLGGSEQFGVNLNVYACQGRLLVVDCGLGFADERFPGIDLLLPDPQILEDNKNKICGSEALRNVRRFKLNAGDRRR